MFLIVCFLGFSPMCARRRTHGRGKISVTYSLLAPYGRTDWKSDGGITVPPLAIAV